MSDQQPTQQPQEARQGSCTCTPGTEATGWMEDRCTACQEAERAQWIRLSEFQAEIRELGLDAWLERQELRSQRALYDYLGMERAQ